MHYNPQIEASKVQMEGSLDPSYTRKAEFLHSFRIAVEEPYRFYNCNFVYCCLILSLADWYLALSQFW